VLCKETFKIAGHDVTVEIEDRVTESDAECWVHTIWIDGKYEAKAKVMWLERRPR